MTESNTQANRLVLYVDIHGYPQPDAMFHARAVIDRMTGAAILEFQDTDALGDRRWEEIMGTIQTCLVRQAALRYLVAARALPTRAIRAVAVCDSNVEDHHLGGWTIKPD